MDKIKILVTGDSVADHHIYRGSRFSPGGIEDQGTSIQSRSGGCCLLADILDHAFKHIKDSAEVITPDFGPLNHHAYAVWEDYRGVWRVSEKMGYGAAQPVDISGAGKTGREDTFSHITVFDDAALSFRFDDTAWPAFIKEKKDIPEWIMVKMSDPLVKGDLWTYLRDEIFRDRLIIVLSADDLRRGEVKISKGISWERTIQDVLTELDTSPALKGLRCCKHLIINFGNEGALWLCPEESFQNSKGTMIFDSGCLEGEWANRILGRMIGSSSCFVSGIVMSVADHLKNTGNAKALELSGGISSGLAAARTLLETGHGPVCEHSPGFPFQAVSIAVTSLSGQNYRKVPLTGAAFKRSGMWSLIEGNIADNPGPLYGRARQVALYGPAVLKDIPYGAYGKLYTVDRSEIESLNGIKKLIHGYVRVSKQDKPLSIGVFGPPGAGKSFGIKQIVQGILGKDVPILEFNLSQFIDQQMLFNALHQVRDKALKGETPVVFWDEFDSRDLYWLQYLLAPMQDGEFLEGQIRHPVGKCIFVFAGGTSYTMENFAPAQIPGNESAVNAFRLKKGPDFVSRLHGYLNVLGPNRRQVFNPETGQWEDDLTDNCFPLRRALLLRVMAGVFGKDEKFDIDFGLLNAFIKIDKFHHGSRSMETIIRLIRADQSGRRLLRSSLPPMEQIAIHVDYDQFLTLIDQDRPFKEQVEKFAKYIHDFYLKMAKDKKWKITYDMPFDELPPPIKEDNIAAARRIPDVFSLISLLVMDKNHGTKKTIHSKVVEEIIDQNIDILAEAEHDLWMKEKMMNGWRPGDRDDAKKLHPCLILFDRLPEKEKEKDRDAVRNYPSIINEAGFMLVYE